MDEGRADDSGCGGGPKVRPAVGRRRGISPAAGMTRGLAEGAELRRLAFGESSAERVGMGWQARGVLFAPSSISRLFP
jgi:hypothetical protein